MRLIYFFLFFTSIAFSQNNDLQTAYELYQNSEYNKAINIYKKKVNNSNLKKYYHPYLECLINLEDYNEAIFLSKKMVNKFPHTFSYQVDLYIMQEKNGEELNSVRTFNKILDNLINKTSELVSTANTFVRYQNYQKALECYDHVIGYNPKYNISFHINIALIYQYMDKDEEMIYEYMSLLNKSPSHKNTVIFYLERYLSNNGIHSDRNYTVVKNSLLEYSQRDGVSEVFSELLVWLFMKNNQFELAFLQAKSIDKRLLEDGKRIYNLAETYLDNEDYDLAIRSYDYIILKGKKNKFYVNSQINKLYSMGKLENPDLNVLDMLYQNTINDLGKNRHTVLLLNNYAYFQAFSLGDLINSKNILEEAMRIPQISSLDLAECKLIYADIMLLSSKIWNALLYYSQVEKDHKDHPIGHEAKFRRAKISYYQGDFELAQSQLNVLKSSTSKLIANDAMYLSLLISDNLNLDTSSSAMEMYATADLLYYQQDYIQSINLLDSILYLFPSHTLIDEVYYRKYEIYYKTGDLHNAIDMLRKIEEGYSSDILYDDAIFNLAYLYENQMNDLEKAFSYYEIILLKCKGSVYTAKSRNRYRLIRGDDL